MHLVIVSPFPPAITGIGQYGYHITRALSDSGAFSRLTVLAGSHGRGTTPNHLGNTELDYCWQPGQWNARRAILSRVTRLKPDLIWFNLGASVFGKSPWANLSGLLTPMVVQRWGYPTVVTLHELVELADLRALDAPGGPLAPLGARLLTALVTRADILCLTMRHYMDWLSTRRLDCAHIPIGAYHEPELLQEPDAPELLFFTTLAPFKGLEVLLEAFCRLRVAHPNLKLTVAGTDHVRFPNYGRELKTRFRGMKGLHWLGEVSEEQVKELFCRAQIVLLPYTASTGSSSVVYQAATWGRAVVASDLPEIRELASEANLHVEFFRSGDVTALCHAIEKLLGSPEKRLQQTLQNFHAIRSTRPVETCRKYLQAFNRALEKRANPRRIKIPGLETRSA